MKNPFENGSEPQENAMSLSLTQAAKAAKISKSTLSVAIQKGRVSAVHLPDGSYQIEPVELFRAFPPKAGITPSNEDTEGVRKPMPNPTEPTKSNLNLPPMASEIAELVLLRAKVEAFDRERELRDRERDTLQGQVADLQKRLDAEQEERRNLQRQLMPPAATQKPQDGPSGVSAGVESSRSSRGFLGRFWSR